MPLKSLIAWLKGRSYYVNSVLASFPGEESSLKGEGSHGFVLVSRAIKVTV